MSNEIENYLGLLDRRLFLVRALAQQFLECRRDFVTMDLDGMYNRIAQQEDLCRQLQLLHPEIVALQQICLRLNKLERQHESGSSADTGWAARISKVIGDLTQAQEEVARLNQIHGAYLRRTSRTNQVLINRLGNYGATYARPSLRDVRQEQKGLNSHG